MNILTVNQLTKSFDSLVAVNDVTFSLTDNKITTLLGPNGSGKTTLIKCILGLMKPDEGNITLFGEHCELPFSEKIRKRILYIPDEPILIDYLSGEENIKYICALYGIDYDEKTAVHILEKYDLLSSKDKMTKQYSRGMLQKLSLCLIDFFCPDLVVIDEPTNGLDVISIQLLADYLHEKTEEGRSIFIATHDISFCNQVSSHVVFMSKGRMIYDASKDLLLEGFGSLENAVTQLLTNNEINQSE